MGKFNIDLETLTPLMSLGFYDGRGSNLLEEQHKYDSNLIAVISSWLEDIGRKKHQNKNIRLMSLKEFATFYKDAYTLFKKEYDAMEEKIPVNICNVDEISTEGGILVILQTDTSENDSRVPQGFDELRIRQNNGTTCAYFLNEHGKDVARASFNYYNQDVLNEYIALFLRHNVLFRTYKDFLNNRHAVQNSMCGVYVDICAHNGDFVKGLDGIRLTIMGRARRGLLISDIQVVVYVDLTDDEIKIDSSKSSAVIDNHEISGADRIFKVALDCIKFPIEPLKESNKNEAKAYSKKGNF